MFAASVALLAVLGICAGETNDHGFSVSQVRSPLRYRSFRDIIRLSPDGLSGRCPIPPNTEFIQLEFTVEDRIITHTSRNYHVAVCVPPHPTLLQVMQAFQDLPESDFSFETIQTSLGPLVITINGITRVERENFWFILLAPNKPLKQGVNETFPTTGEHYIFRLTAINNP